MIRTDEDALICDFAETYNIYDYKGLPLKTAASLAVGLRDNSRIKMIMSGEKYTPETLMIASILDGVNWLVWSKTKDGQDNKNRPSSILDRFVGRKEETVGYISGEEYEKARKELLQQIGAEHGN